MPLIVTGASVAGAPRTVDALVNTTDVFATVMAVHGIVPAEVDGGFVQDTSSFLPYVRNQTPPSPRQTIFSDVRSRDRTTLSSAIRNARYKLIRRVRTAGPTEEFYDLQVDPQEETDLMLAAGPAGEARTNYAALKAHLDGLLQ